MRYLSCFICTAAALVVSSSVGGCNGDKSEKAGGVTTTTPSSSQTNSLTNPSTQGSAGGGNVDAPRPLRNDIANGGTGSQTRLGGTENRQQGVPIKPSVTTNVGGVRDNNTGGASGSQTTPGNGSATQTNPASPLGESVDLIDVSGAISFELKVEAAMKLLSPGWSKSFKVKNPGNKAAAVEKITSLNIQETAEWQTAVASNPSMGNVNVLEKQIKAACGVADVPEYLATVCRDPSAFAFDLSEIIASVPIKKPIAIPDTKGGSGNGAFTDPTDVEDLDDNEKAQFFSPPEPAGQADGFLSLKSKLQRAIQLFSELQTLSGNSDKRTALESSIRKLNLRAGSSGDVSSSERARNFKNGVARNLTGMCNKTAVKRICGSDSRKEKFTNEMIREIQRINRIKDAPSTGGNNAIAPVGPPNAVIAVDNDGNDDSVTDDMTFEQKVERAMKLLAKVWSMQFKGPHSQTERASVRKAEGDHLIKSLEWKGGEDRGLWGPINTICAKNLESLKNACKNNETKTRFMWDLVHSLTGDVPHKGYI